MDNYLMLDGKKYELSPELVNALRSIDPVQEEKKAFARNGGDDSYWYIGSKGIVCEDVDRNYDLDASRHAVANYCTGKALMEQRALHETLNRLLWRYSEMNGGGEKRGGYFIYRSGTEDMRVGHCTYATCGDVYFRKKEVAEAAIEEIVKPFVAAHPEFVW